MDALTAEKNDSNIRVLDEGAMLQVYEERISRSLKEIRELDLWKQWGSYRSYCRRRWGIARDLDRCATRFPGGVYFARPGNRGCVKIGFAGDFESRIAQLQTASPEELRIVGVIPGATIEEEHAIHRLLAAYCIGGEWFAWCGQIRSYIEQHTFPYIQNDTTKRPLALLRELFEQMNDCEREQAATLWSQWIFNEETKRSASL